MNNKQKNEKGYILILALAFFSFTVILLTSIICWVFSERNLVLNYKYLKQARANAKLAVQMACVELEKRTLSDRHITYEKDGKLVVGDAIEGHFLAFMGQKEVVLSGGQGKISYIIEDLGLRGEPEHCSILANPKTGKLKCNLLDYFENGKSLKDTDELFETKDLPDYMEAPKWGLLRSYYALVNTLDKGNKHLKPQPFWPVKILSTNKKDVKFFEGPIQYGVGPLVKSFQLSYKINHNKVHLEDSNIEIFLDLVLWNPYSVFLEPYPYYVEITVPKAKPVSLRLQPRNSRISLSSNEGVLFKGGLSFSSTLFKPGETKAFRLHQSYSHANEGLVSILKKKTPLLESVSLEKVLGGKCFFSLRSKEDKEGVFYHLELPFSPNNETSAYVKHPFVTGKAFTLAFTCEAFNKVSLLKNKRNFRAFYEDSAITKAWKCEAGYNFLPLVVGSTELQKVLFSFNKPVNWDSVMYFKEMSLAPFAHHPSVIIGSCAKSPLMAEKNEVFLDEGARNIALDYAYYTNAILWDAFFMASIKQKPHLQELSLMRESSVNSVKDDVLLAKRTININSLSQKAWQSRLARVSLLDVLQKKLLAEKLVEIIEQRGPFFSLGEFINRDVKRGLPGVLQEALQKSDLTFWQEDILPYLVPFLSARSDTFRVHATGYALNPDTGKTVAQASITKTYQRFYTSDNKRYYSEIY